ncbi:MAG: hypothetical protein K0Q79_601 [Flavipsychrobacter sp.]|nr:hypothetical protein [Flavipsychrobacter sp.]
MRKVLLISALLLAMSNFCMATDKNSDELLSFINLTPPSVTQQKITNLLGTPAKIEESKKRVMWYYTHGNTNLIISWNKKSELPEKFSFTSTPVVKPTFDNGLARKLKSGQTDISQALKILGPPHDMTIRESKQEMHYSYEGKMLRLFFRNRMLVDFCLY